MNKRLLKFLEAENISQSQFADSIGVARASISHVISGRNKPGFEFFERTAQRYPSLSLEWLITGQGRMYKSADGQEPEENLLFSPENSPSSPSGRKISRITVFYTDDTFEEFTKESLYL